MMAMRIVLLMHDILEAHCKACGFSLKGLDDLRAMRETECRMCGLPLRTRTNLAVSRRLPLGMGLLMGAFAASLDASPLLARGTAPVPGFARRQGVESAR